MTNPLGRLQSDGTAGGTRLAEAEDRAIQGQELWWTSPGPAGVVVTGDTALGLTSVLATHNVLATDVAVLPLDVYQRQPDGGRRDAFEHPVSEILRRSPDGRTTPVKWFSALMGHALRRGNGYAEIQRRGRGTPHALHLLDPERTWVEDRGERPGYSVDGEGGRRWIEAANVLHIAGLGYDGVTGHDFIRLIEQSIGLGLAADSFAADYFANGAEPGGMVEVPGKLSAVAVQNLRDSWDDKHRGPGRRHRPGVLQEGAKWVGTSTDPEKSQLVETRRFQVNDAVRPWRVPPHKIGDFSQAHLSNIEAANLDYLMTALIGWLEVISQECNLKLFTLAEYRAGYYVEHNYNALLKGDITSRFNAYAVALNNGWMNRDEVRRRENMNPIGEAGGGSKYLVPLNMTPLDQAGQAAPEAPPPAPAEARANPCHGADGKFCAGGGSGGPFAGAKAYTSLDEPFVTIKQKTDAREALTQASAGWLQSLTGDERAAISAYKNNGYRQVNGSLRKGKEPGARARQLDSALSKSTLDEDTVVYRAIKGKVGRDLNASGGVGAEIHDKGFMSTSADHSDVMTFVGGNKESAVLAVRVRAGTKAAYIDNEDFRHQHRETEILLPRNGRLKVTARLPNHRGVTAYAAEYIASDDIGERSTREVRADEPTQGQDGDRSDYFVWSEGDVEIVPPDPAEARANSCHDSAGKFCAGGGGGVGSGGGGASGDGGDPGPGRRDYSDARAEVERVAIATGTNLSLEVGPPETKADRRVMEKAHDKGREVIKDTWEPTVVSRSEGDATIYKVGHRDSLTVRRADPDAEHEGTGYVVLSHRTNPADPPDVEGTHKTRAAAEKDAKSMAERQARDESGVEYHTSKDLAKVDWDDFAGGLEARRNASEWKTTLRILTAE